MNQGSNNNDINNINAPNSPGIISNDNTIIMADNSSSNRYMINHHNSNNYNDNTSIGNKDNIRDISQIDFIADHSGINLLQVDVSPSPLKEHNDNYSSQMKKGQISSQQSYKKNTILNQLRQNQNLNNTNLNSQNNQDFNDEFNINMNIIKQKEISERSIIEKTEVHRDIEQPVQRNQSYNNKIKKVMQRQEEIDKVKEKYRILNIGNVDTELTKAKYNGKVMDILISCVVTLNVLIALYENYDFTTLRVKDPPPDKPANMGDEFNDILKYGEILCSFILIVMIVIRYYFYLVQLRRENIASKNDNLFTTGLWKGLLVEAILMSIFSPPGTFSNSTITGYMLGGSYTYSWDSIFTFVICYKSYYAVRLFMIFSKWNNEETLNIAKENGINLGFVFALKSSIKQYPFIFLSIIMGITLAFCGFLIRLFEQGFTPNVDPSAPPSIKGGNPDFEAYLDSFWLVIITMLTVGYGDLFPKTHLGRIVAIWTTISGMVIVSFLIVSLTNWTELTPEEKKSYVLIKREEAIQDMNSQAKTFMRKIMRIFFLRSQKFTKAGR